jgi:hypothetical protein
MQPHVAKYRTLESHAIRMKPSIYRPPAKFITKFAKGLTDVAHWGVVVTFMPDLKILGYGLVQQGAFGVVWPSRVRMRVRLRGTGGDGQGAVPERACWLGLAAAYHCGYTPKYRLGMPYAGTHPLLN